MLQYKNNITEIGLDEAGRGPLIGRVYAGAVIWPENISSDMIRDSKKLTPKKRAIALDWIKNNITLWGVGYADEKEIDKINILEATRIAMGRAINDLKSKDQSNINNDLIIDGCGWEKKFPNFNVTSIVGGDNKFYSIAAASIIAKQFHDNHIRELMLLDNTMDCKYGLSTNMGYPTKKHMDGIKLYGPTIYHRKTFKGVIL